MNRVIPPLQVKHVRVTDMHLSIAEAGILCVLDYVGNVVLYVCDMFVVCGKKEYTQFRREIVSTEISVPPVNGCVRNGC